MTKSCRTLIQMQVIFWIWLMNCRFSLKLNTLLYIHSLREIGVSALTFTFLFSLVKLLMPLNASHHGLLWLLKNLLTATDIEYMYRKMLKLMPLWYSAWLNIIKKYEFILHDRNIMYYPYILNSEVSYKFKSCEHLCHES